MKKQQRILLKRAAGLSICRTSNVIIIMTMITLVLSLIIAVKVAHSLVSDAFSSAARNAPDDIEAAVFASARSNCKNLSFKRRKAKASAVLNDHDLEDTASSPANSPKVSSLNQLNHTRNDKDNINVSEANVCRKNSTAEEAGSAAHEEKNNQSELKKRGLCLVPVSTLTNYFARFSINYFEAAVRAYFLFGSCMIRVPVKGN
nr:vascular-related unknown protein 4-like isoform X1 [Coffea arabica]